MIQIYQDNEGAVDMKVDFPKGSSSDLILDSYLTTAIAVFDSFISLALQYNSKETVLDIVDEMTKHLTKKNIETIQNA